MARVKGFGTTRAGILISSYEELVINTRRRLRYGVWQNAHRVAESSMVGGWCVFEWVAEGGGSRIIVFGCKAGADLYNIIRII